MRPVTVDWVVRAGVATPDLLKAAYAQDKQVPGVYGFSVQYAPGVDWPDLVAAGHFPHNSICYADRTVLETVLAPLGYSMLLVATPGRGYHHELELVLMQHGAILDHLPDDAAVALSTEFRKHLVRIKP